MAWDLLCVMMASPSRMYLIRFEGFCISKTFGSLFLIIRFQVTVSPAPVLVTELETPRAAGREDRALLTESGCNNWEL